MRSPQEIYRRFIEFEEQAAGIYMQMASRFSHENPELASLWLDMGMEEKQHAGLLQFCLAEKLLATELPDEAEIATAEQLFARLSKEATSPGLSTESAFKIAAVMETSEINTIYDRLTTPVHPSMYLLRRKIATMQNHIGHVLQEARKFNVSETTIKELERIASGYSSQ
jgi:rubrerythrin